MSGLHKCWSKDFGQTKDKLFRKKKPREFGLLVYVHIVFNRLMKEYICHSQVVSPLRKLLLIIMKCYVNGYPVLFQRSFSK